ncbi:hypothetical protein [Lactobacillus paragasseri]|uniref:Bacteriocin immunity protein n=1 Tax=Lactobacillus paragasseri TaxID=2107999 RepID=A0ABD4ZZD0_9LACO|nr:hypothetical protein [Lactobacillus paragasseri]MDK7952171.1 hypothetical protein [Lactobacillus paragasseri]MDO6360825.1 hypothetical protein [Lactobacillus paragasseri]
MKRAKIFDKEKFDWALDSALNALYRQDEETFMKRVTDMELSSEMNEKNILYMFALSAYTTSLTSSFIYGGHK